MGKGQGNTHNVHRSTQMHNQLKRVGINDTASGRQYLSEHFTKVLNDPSNVLKTEVRSFTMKELPGQPVRQYVSTVRESLLMGPGGGLQVTSFWDSNRLLTVILKGGH